MVKGILEEDKKPEDLYLDRLPKATQKAFRFIIDQEIVSSSEWYLAGGTALALQVGHRESVDLDFFTQTATFDEDALERMLAQTKTWETTLRQKGTIYGKLLGAKVSFIAYPFFQPSTEYIRCGNIRILIPEDIAAMKIIAISQRGRKRDFIDLYWYCHNREPLKHVIERAIKQFPQNHNIPHFFKSLVYFADAEEDPIPNLHFEVKWQDVKKFFEKEVPKLTREMLELNP